MTQILKAGAALFTTRDDPECDGVTAAREFIMMHELTKEDVKLVKRDGMIQVIKRKDVIGGYWGE